MRRLAAGIVLALLVACTPPTTAPDGTAGTSQPAAKPAINEQTRGAIQALLQKKHNATVTRDQKTFESTIDPERRALLRCAVEEFDIDGRQGARQTPQVGKIEAYLDIYVRAWASEGSLGLRRIFFRQLPDGKWVQTEPKDDELGGEKKATIEDIQIDYWAIDEDVVDGLRKGTLAAKQTVLENLLSDSRRDPLAIRFYPTRSVAGIQGCTTVGFHWSNVPTDPYVRFFRYWFNTDGSMSAPTITFITHEWLHWAQDQFSPGISARMPWWLTEGWPDYVGQSRSESVNRSVICQTSPTLKQLEDGGDPNGPPEVGVQYYSFANSMVEYLYATYGGKEGYKKLVLAFKGDARPSVAFPAAFGITPEKFFDDWKVWATKTRYRC